MDNGSMINLTSYTSSHLMFVSNHSGTTVTELFLIIIIPHSIFLFQVFWTLWPISLLLHSTFGFIVQIVWIVIPQLLLTTILDSYAVPVGEYTIDYTFG